MPKMLHNDSHKFESGFVNVTIQPNHSVMLKSLAGSRLGIWIAHGEGKFSLPYAESEYHIPIKYSYDAYPGNPNGSPFATAAICSKDGRHLTDYLPKTLTLQNDSAECSKIVFINDEDYIDL